MRSLVALILMSVPVLAAPQIREADLDRLARLEESAGGAILQAFQGGADEDVAALTEALADRPVPPAPQGDWQCRTLRAGGRTSLEVYAPFTCRITVIGPTEWRFEKLTGSERSVGTIAFHEGRAVYRGVGFSGGAPATDYAGLPATPEGDAPNDTHPQVAVFEQTGPGKARLMFPYPRQGGTFDVLHLTR